MCVATMEVKEDFYMYRSGIYRYSSPPQPVTSSAQSTGYHSVRIIGYCTVAVALTTDFIHDKLNTLNPLTPTVVICVQLQSILCQTGLSRHL